jgi:hypothetical protein
MGHHDWLQVHGIEAITFHQLLGPFHRGCSTWGTGKAIPYFFAEVAQILIGMPRGKFGIVYFLKLSFMTLSMHQHRQKEKDPKHFFHEERYFLGKVKNAGQKESTFLPSENPLCP